MTWEIAERVDGSAGVTQDRAVEPHAGARMGRVVVLGPVLLALVVRTVYWVFVTPAWRPNSDADQYLQIARNIAAGDGYSLVFPELSLHATAFRPPLYPVVLALPTWVFGQQALWPARVLSIVIALGVVALTVVFVRRIAGDLAGIVAGCAVAVMPRLIANDTVTLSESLGLLLMLAVFLLLDSRRPVLTGLAAGALILTRPNAYLVAIVAAAFLWRWLGWRKAALSIGCCALLVVPWAIRNRIQVDTWSITTSQGFTLAAIYAPAAQERGTFVDPVLDGAYDESRFRLLQFNEGEWDRELTGLAVRSARESPGYVTDVVRTNLLAFLELTPEENEFAEGVDGRNLRFRDATVPLFHVYVVAGFAGLAMRARDRRLWPAYLVVGQFALLSLVTVSPPRLRAPLDLLLCIGVGLLAAAVCERGACAAVASRWRTATWPRLRRGDAGPRPT